MCPGNHDRVCRPEECHQLSRGGSTKTYNQGTKREGSAEGGKGSMCDLRGVIRQQQTKVVQQLKHLFSSGFIHHQMEGP